MRKSDVKKSLTQTGEPAASRLGLTKAVWAMAASRCATVSAVEQIMLRHNHKRAFPIVVYSFDQFGSRDVDLIGRFFVWFNGCRLCRGGFDEFVARARCVLKFVVDSIQKAHRFFNTNRSRLLSLMIEYD